MLTVLTLLEASLWFILNLSWTTNLRKSGFKNKLTLLDFKKKVHLEKPPEPQRRKYLFKKTKFYSERSVWTPAIFQKLSANYLDLIILLQ